MPPYLQEGKDDAELYGLGWAEAAAEGTLGGSALDGGAAPTFPPGGGPRIEPTGASEFHERFRELDERYLKPLFGGRTGRAGDNSGEGGGGGGDSPLGSVAGDVEGPALRRPLFSDQHFYFQGCALEEGHGQGQEVETHAVGSSLSPSPPPSNGAAAPASGRWGGASSAAVATVQMEQPGGGSAVLAAPPASGDKAAAAQARAAAPRQPAASQQQQPSVGAAHSPTAAPEDTIMFGDDGA